MGTDNAEHLDDPKPNERDERLHDVLDRVTAQCRHGQWPDLESLIRQHPDLADDLRALWPAIVIAEEAAHPSPELAQTIVDPADRADGSNGSLYLPRAFGDYELIEQLGRGGMGVVYKAQQRSLGRTVALKMLLDAQLASATDHLRFKAEAEAAARLDHPNIVPVYEIGEQDGRAYFTMKYVEGTTLADRVSRGPLPSTQAAELLLTVAQAVQHAHQYGILHRDLKPSNILIDRDHQPLVADFGLAKRVEGGDRLTNTGGVVGTPSYMPPEQAAGSRGTLGPASDVYSLGAILYHLLTGRPPFQAATPVDTLMLVLEQDPLPPRLLNPQVDRELEMICLKCLEKPTNLRYASAAALAKDLEAYLHGGELSIAPSNFGYFVLRMLRPTHNEAILDNWGGLWMAHAFKVMIQCALTAWLAWAGVSNRVPYLLLWGVLILVWSAAFWAMRKRIGPVTFVERQIAHVWGAAVIASILLFFLEMLMDLPVLTLSPVLCLLAGVVFMIKAGIVSGTFYVAAGTCFVTALVMPLLPLPLAILLFGVVIAGCFFFPGLKYYRRRRRA